MTQSPKKFFKHVPSVDDLVFIGKGAIGTVWLYHDRGLNRNEAIKILDRAAFVKNEVAGIRHIANKLDKHPAFLSFNWLSDEESAAVERLYQRQWGDDWKSLRGWGQNQCESQLDTTVPVISMSYFPGRPISEFLSNQRNHLRHLEIAVRQLLQALQALDQIQKWHGDLKPNNILINSNGELKLVDYSLVNCSESNFSQWDELNPRYRAPEELQNSVRRGQSIEADLFSLGLIVFEQLGGTIPDRKESPDWRPVLPNQEGAQWLTDLLPVLVAENPADRRQALKASRTEKSKAESPNPVSTRSRWQAGVLAGTVVLAALLIFWIWSLWNTGSVDAPNRQDDWPKFQDVNTRPKPEFS